MTTTWMVRGAAALAFCFAAQLALAADDQPWKDGPVTDVTSVRTKPGHFFDYVSYLNAHWKPSMEEAKKQGIIVGYAMYGVTPKSPSDPDLYLTVTYPNMAALDTIDDKMNAIEKKLNSMTPAQADKAAGDRETIRTILGDELIREMILK